MSSSWWVNHDKTYVEEIAGGYIWSPKREKGDKRSQFYENLTCTAPGELIFSFARAKICAIGIVIGQCSEAPKPQAFGGKGTNWSALGWLVPIRWELLAAPFAPKGHFAQIRSLLPSKYSPLTKVGNGSQKCYLAKISEPLASTLLAIAEEGDAGLLDRLDDLRNDSADLVSEMELIQSQLATTEKDQLVKARLGQGAFRQNVLSIEKCCRMTGMDDMRLLIASHIKAWRYCSNKERLDGYNGLMLSPHVDKLFDKGWISFSDEGDTVVIDPRAIGIMVAWGLDPNANVGPFSKKQCHYLAFHRANSRERVKAIK